jgi:hypothetical protein
MTEEEKEMIGEREAAKFEEGKMRARIPLE